MFKLKGALVNGEMHDVYLYYIIIIILIRLAFLPHQIENQSSTRNSNMARFLDKTY